MKRLHLAVPGAAGLILAATISLASGPSSDATALEGEAAYRYMQEQISGRIDSAEFYDVAKRYADYLPNQAFRSPSGATAPLSSALVIGTINSVQPAVGYRIEGRDADSGDVTGFDDPDAIWRVLEVGVSVDHSFGRTSGAKEVYMGITIDGRTDAQSVINGLFGRKVVAPLDGQGFFEHDDELWNISRSESMLGFIGSSGRFESPFIEPLSPAWHTPQILDEVLAMAIERRPTIALETQDGLLAQP